MADPGERVAETSGHQHRWTRRSWKAQRRFCVCGEWEPEPDLPLRPPPEPYLTPEEMLREFHQVKAVHGGYMPRWPTAAPPAWIRDLRAALLAEEVAELGEAIVARDIVKIADALADIVYVAVGTAVTYGIPFDAVFAEVHRSNMTKANAPDEAKLVKGPGYEPPRIAELLGLGDEPAIDVGYLSLPADLQAALESGEEGDGG